MIIGIDLDGVAYDFVSAMRKYAHEVYEVPLETMPTAVSWDFPVHDWGWTMEEFLNVFEEGVNSLEIFNTGDPYPGVKEGIDRLRAAGHHVHIVTHRESVGEPGIAVISTVTWLAHHGIAYDSISFTKNKSIVRADVFIEDNVNNFLDLWKNDIPSFIRTQPYNAANIWSADEQAVEMLWRVSSFDEFVGKALAYGDALNGNITGLATAILAASQPVAV